MLTDPLTEILNRNFSSIQELTTRYLEASNNDSHRTYATGST